LQGGGAHGAFTWGALDRLLEEDGLEIAWVSATSAGAINAAALAAGLANGGPAAARAVLRQVWEAVEKAGVPDLVRFNPFFYGLTRSAPLPNVAGLLSPYEFNPLNFDPFRQLLTAHIDFEKIRTAPGGELLIAATDVATGRARLFRRRELTVEAVLASACLPSLHHAVEIGGRAYWDGGFSANPDIVTLASESRVADTLIVLLNPLERRNPPRSARDIADRVNTITFNQPFLRDAEFVAMAQETKLGWRASRRLKRLRRHRFHLLEAGRYTMGLSTESKLTPDRGLLNYLYASGRSEMHKWLERHGASIGRRQTVDLRRRILDAGRVPWEPLEADVQSGRQTALAAQQGGT
ncbi:MAG TPA: patatin-like phospholipase family protein, partial [Hyphomicrobiaceae bacterium]|nr:patatin-like phospholipase family protein [Hyphomicrobiaceae bacterium]